MLPKKLQYILKKVISYINEKMAFVNFNMIVGAVFYIFLITVLSVNAYTAYNRGIDNLHRIDEEQKKTDILQKENTQLQNLYKYYNSLDYKLMYARDNLNMGEKNETLYYIDRHESLDIEGLPDNKPKARPVDNVLLWGKLLFNI